METFVQGIKPSFINDASDLVCDRYSYSGGGGGGGYGGGSYSGPDVEQMKDDLKHGISSLAGKLSRATASVMDSIQVPAALTHISSLPKIFETSINVFCSQKMSHSLLVE